MGSHYVAYLRTANQALTILREAGRCQDEPWSRNPYRAAKELAPDHARRALGYLAMVVMQDDGHLDELRQAIRAEIQDERAAGSELEDLGT